MVKSVPDSTDSLAKCDSQSSDAGHCGSDTNPPPLFNSTEQLLWVHFIWWPMRQASGSCGRPDVLLGTTMSCQRVAFVMVHHSELDRPQSHRNGLGRGEPHHGARQEELSERTLVLFSAEPGQEA